MWFWLLSAVLDVSMAAVADRAWRGSRAGAAPTEWLRLEPALPRAELL